MVDTRRTSTPDSADPTSIRIAVLRARGTGDKTRIGVENFAGGRGFGWERVLAKNVGDEVSPDRFDVLYVPGGWAWPYVKDIDPAGKDAIRSFVAASGCFVGVCAGAYFAADLIRWQGRFVEYDLDLFRGLAEGPIDDIEPWYGWRMTPLEPEQHDINERFADVAERDGAGFEAVYWGGPSFQLSPHQEVDVLARYGATGEVATLTFPYGHGQVLIMGCHLELGLYPKGRFDRQGGHGARWDWLEVAVCWMVAQARRRRDQASKGAGGEGSAVRG